MRYIQSMIRSLAVWQWLFRLVDSKEWRKLAVAHYCVTVCSMIANLIQPGILGMIVTAVALGESNKALLALLCLGAIVTLQLLCVGSTNHSHQRLWGLGIEAVTVGIFRRFVSKSPGQHAQLQDFNPEPV